ncbi:Uncharacterised protein [Porphyromonas macacae]|uniref:Uncharacterized protein n=1 Tax=Porphyromonas macacae TaxID=28115 RepID=A0A379E8J3_9PORP|nr:Uncharacterised protein [Porphyromonas macacae]
MKAEKKESSDTIYIRFINGFNTLSFNMAVATAYAG